MGQDKLKVLSIFGTRPEAIKMAPVVKELERRPDSFESVVAVTAQHREMLDQVLDLFKIEPDYDLDIMKPGQDLFDITSRALLGLKPVLEDAKPDIILVQGDTTTTFIAALAAFYLKVQVGHVEAGLRSFDKHHPFPEEINRALTTVIADYHFPPTQTSKQNLLACGVPEERIYITGNTVIDALIQTIKPGYTFTQPDLKAVDFDNKRIILVTSHRRENWGEPLRQICRAIKEIAQKNPDIEVVFSVHLNPLVQQTAREILGGVERVHLIKPLDYEPFVQLIDKSYLILTDSGGIQEEAPSLGKPVLVLREVTERPEGVEAGTVRVVGRDMGKIVDAAQLLLGNAAEYNKMARAVNPYGDGHASQRIADILEKQRIAIND
ncbi:MAG: UDP-N-acetylglucosamine 2-epimerase [Candidatus Aquicultor secundus]|uniref:UDP-N-acetylglucosamine 2-epimerase (non-hydrolyzing) n=1 Tax=Candidatus Aquicultor secundus TaxID=1973895 RepID=A0A2M7T718_9ACTN|nr:UDP-N-acetylglucosamine 2-epimerase (non-hydrolyzing) [Candidatus Aquicultor secundus]NCO65160.1 UDP-N-acetylglucosamine 2-epimerase (non-hydrolyzing) [Solirubrobacter sp.]OIO87756.1 MAG: UDP-N-acetylglucosamine 2-epimerase [Candidatus Aquicultor secundus]PIU27000.1 MAG: UDP-N-acetylglucosamine 2-epimerase (non-hydrolyzing) [Candidatus Aquicultor secundus]PIX51634.1 MAG: UDP-N-acetylglucosamine 2-epimerase (non-hydrolyzing) [Candidatus Aquicultor secundus]PIY38526.1 MAG: UDP-N-acetylglucosa